MPTLTPYLLFDGTCRQAMQFYQACLGGELSVLPVMDSPASSHMTAALQDKIINARLRGEGLDISASDWLMPGSEPIRGNTACLFLNRGTLPRLKALFERLSEGAEVTDPWTEQFFGAYAALNDKFGVRWMFHTDQRS